MKNDIPTNKQTSVNERQPHLVRLPGFINDQDIGLGDVIKRVTSTFGIRPCGGCKERAAMLNRWMVFINRRTH